MGVIQLLKRAAGAGRTPMQGLAPAATSHGLAPVGPSRLPSAMDSDAGRRVLALPVAPLNSPIPMVVGDRAWPDSAGARTPLATPKPSVAARSGRSTRSSATLDGVPGDLSTPGTPPNPDSSSPSVPGLTSPGPGTLPTDTAGYQGAPSWAPIQAHATAGDGEAAGEGLPFARPGLGHPAATTGPAPAGAISAGPVVEPSAYCPRCSGLKFVFIEPDLTEPCVICDEPGFARWLFVGLGREVA